MEVIILKDENCPHCKELLEKIDAQGGVEGKTIKSVDLLTEEGMNIAAELEIDGIPTAVTPDKLQCEITYTDDHVDIVCPGDESGNK